ncbi:hypothetical protein VNI00_010293 [Paramarasmius palmivorus]|uniref:Uncharacterized protein n=1 Tax=Paramarasmius palmivorus TaxID=297713 RepID=A0AAW0CJ74_9AGAR
MNMHSASNLLNLHSVNSTDHGLPSSSQQEQGVSTVYPRILERDPDLPNLGPPIYESPSQSTFSGLYCLPTTSITPAPIVSFSDPGWHWPVDAELVERIKTLPSELLPPPITIPAPAGFSYPLAPIYSLRMQDWRFAAGCCYVTNFDPSSKANTRDQLVRTLSPHGTNPIEYNAIQQSFTMAEIEGMTPLVPGIPFGVAIDGDPSRFVTIACLQTLDSLYTVASSSTYRQIHEACDQLWQISWGLDDDGPGLALYDLGLTRNLRSGDAPPDGSPDGSFSIATTQEQGRGRGTISPAVQANSPIAKERLSKALELLNSLYHLIAPLCMSKWEWDVTQFRDIDMNVFSAGGLFPGPTSVQLNVSSSWEGGSLELSIGRKQGKWHVDKNDHWARWTLLVIFMRLPKGSDMGAFLLARAGLYARVEVNQSGEVRLFLLFKGNDLHCGTSPSVNEQARNDFLKEFFERYQKVDKVNRLAFVMYPNYEAIERTSPIVAAPPTGLGNDLLLAEGHGQRLHNFVDDGIPALGSRQSWLTRLCYEQFYRMHNTMFSMGYTTPFVTGIRTLDGDETHVMPPPFNPVSHNSWVAFMRAHYKTHHKNSWEYYIAMTKSDFRRGQKQARKDSSNARVPVNILPSSNSSLPPPPPLVSQWNATRVLRKVGLNQIQLPEGQAAKRRRLYKLDSALHPVYLASEDEDDTSSSAAPVLKPSKRRLHRRILSPEIESPPPSPVPQSPLTIPSDVDMDDEETSPARAESPFSRLSSPELQYSVSFLVSENPASGTFMVRWEGLGAEEDKEIPSEDIEYVHLFSMMSNLFTRSSPTLITEFYATRDRDQHDAALSSISQNSYSYKALQNLLTLSTLRGEVLEMQGLEGRLSKKSLLPSVYRVEELLKDCDVLRAKQTELEMSYDSPSDAITLSLLSGLEKAQEVYYETEHASLQLDAVRHAVNFMTCRSLLYVFHWHSIYGPYIAQYLFASPNETTLLRDFPSLGPLAIAIKTALQGLEGSQQKNRTISIPRDKLPPSLFGSDRNGSVSYQVSSRCGLSRPQTFHTSCIEVFIDFCSLYGLTVALRGTEQRLGRVRAKSKGKDGQKQLRKLQDSMLTRGAFLDCFLEVFDHDGLFCCSQMQHFLKAPWNLFGSKIEVHSVALRIQNDPDDAMAPFLRLLKLNPDKPGLQEEGRQLLEALTRCIVQMGTIPLPRGVKSRKATRKFLENNPYATLPHDDPSQPLVDAFPTYQMPQFGLLSIILREVFAKADSEEAYSYPLRRILDGQDPHTSTFRRGDPDHFNPIRARNGAQQLLQETMVCMAPESDGGLRSRWGLSNILLRLGTGQGNLTADFARTHLTEWFESSERCAQVFEQVEEENEHCDQPLIYFNSRCWGQPSDSLSLKPSPLRPQPMREKLSRFFSHKVQDEWATFVSEPRTYAEALQLGIDIDVDGFGKNSLTGLQLANTLCLFDLCSPPSVPEMASIVLQLDKGAIVGLQILGFDGPLTLASITQAFWCVYTFLDHYLNDQQKDMLQFGPIFVEHFLCKLGRWVRMYTLSKLEDLRKEALLNADDNGRSDGYPLPLFISDRALLEKYVQDTVAKLTDSNEDVESEDE